jgi:hypothetical protein
MKDARQWKCCMWCDRRRASGRVGNLSKWRRLQRKKLAQREIMEQTEEE